MESNQSSRFTSFVRSVKQNLPLYSSWAQSSSDKITEDNQAHLSVLDLEIYEWEIGPDQLLGDSTEPDFQCWLGISIKSVEEGKIDEINMQQGAELIQQHLNNKRSGTDGIPDASVSFGAKSRPSLSRSYHVDNCLAQVSKHLLRALTSLSSCCDGEHIARIQLCEFEADTTTCSQDERSFGLYVSSNKSVGNCVWHEVICRVTRFSGSFGFRHHISPITRHRLDGPRACLGELIDDRALAEWSQGNHYPPADKAALCLNLALGMLHLSAEAWLQQPWSIDNIYFPTNHSPESRKPDISLPFLSRTLEIGYTASSESPPVARSPILAFAQVITEICLWKRLPLKSYSNDTVLRKTLDLFTQDSGVSNSQHYAVIEAISACINFYVRQISNSITHNIPSQDPDACWVFDMIVRRLEKVSACYARSTDSRKRFEVEQFETEIMDETKPRSEAPPEISRHQIGDTMNRPLHTTEKTWFDKLRELNHVLDAVSDVENYSKVKIAVLDTGIDPECQFIDEIDDYADFVNPGSRVKLDRTGHGTSVVDLIYRVYQHAEIYVARVFESNNATPETPRHVNEAIDWARGHGVDIVCMAFGFEADTGTVEALLSHVRSAVLDQILLFAAASNGSYATDVMLPARLDDNVFCIFSTDAGGRHSRSMNPPPLDLSYNFAILGEDVRLYRGGLDSGCSYSTAIACAFAARLLDFSRHKDDATEFEYAHFLKDKRGMAMVLSDLSEREAEYHCIKPWKLLGRRWDYGAHHSATALRDTRKKIRDKISDILEDY
ncbi:extracellular alkaline serine protease [Colletotrichum paranaense]|uniref:Extracellular alkaline serine protease n=1 Tax=Colletotrichum paranaense TaxID=1914294 RepID=A0ABQ9T7B8_9PEZI|nr:extracellular alkaline serine protease [Colletotrichum paranaense]KAK1547677.1 extracellular alkaline serine protease [Colletotrichum paranaense]